MPLIDGSYAEQFDDEGKRVSATMDWIHPTREMSHPLEIKIKEGRHFLDKLRATARFKDLRENTSFGKPRSDWPLYERIKEIAPEWDMNRKVTEIDGLMERMRDEMGDRNVGGANMASSHESGEVAPLAVNVLDELRGHGLGNSIYDVVERMGYTIDPNMGKEPGGERLWERRNSEPKEDRLMKMGRIFRGGTEGTYPSYFAMDPEVATAHALGGHFGDNIRIPSNLYEIDDDRIDTEAMQQILAEFYSHGAEPQKDLVSGAMDNLSEEWGQGSEGDLKQVFNDAGRPSPMEMREYYEQNLKGLNQIGDRPPALGREAIEFLQNGPIAMFMEPQGGQGYISPLQQFMGNPNRGSEENPQYPGGQQARDSLLSRLIPDDQVGAEIQRPMLEQSIRDMIANQQGVGHGNRNMTGQMTEQLKQQMRDAGYEWLAYMDRDPRNTLTLQNLVKPRDFDWSKSKKLFDMDPDDMQDDMEGHIVQCGGCGKTIPMLLSNEDRYGEYNCDECHEDLEDDDSW